ncbi:hypothetical protein NE237_013611 [Protea cynaroides]|uniref:Uncharacterized protein n=1 Tax=Protea cynaroides TaxID=273540 RepID=A0A9Q0H218_9MAGN|nr:hypothetical protein NE237_013611 [Protea cynaroides]
MDCTASHRSLIFECPNVKNTKSIFYSSNLPSSTLTSYHFLLTNHLNFHLSKHRSEMAKLQNCPFPSPLNHPITITSSSCSSFSSISLQSLQSFSLQGIQLYLPKSHLFNSQVETYNFYGAEDDAAMISRAMRLQPFLLLEGDTSEF